jgi:hypothetical protein
LWPGSAARSLAAMTERTPNDRPGIGLDPESAPATPRWIPALVIAAVVLVVVIFAVLHLTGVMGGGSH